MIVNIIENLMITVIIVDMDVKGIVKVLKGSGEYMTEKRLNIDLIEDLFVREELIRLYEENEQLKQAYNDAKKDVEKKEQILENIMEHNLLIQYMRNELKE